MYKRFVRRALFAVSTDDAEYAHDLVLSALSRLTRGRFPEPLVRFLCRVEESVLEQTLFPSRVFFPNPVGLAAGMDKNGVAIDAFAALGFGFVEVGTVTGFWQGGNDRPRMFRLAEDRAIVNRMGFNNDGVDTVAHRLAERRHRSGCVLGVNIGKSKVVPLESSVGEYVMLAQMFAPYCDYLVLNVSSPNTPRLRELQNADSLSFILSRVIGAIRHQHEPSPAILVKLAPDLEWPVLEEVVDAAWHSGADGIIATNTTVARNGLRSPNAKESGGLSGAPLRKRATEVISRIADISDGRLTIIGVGGVFCVEDVIEKLRAGAHLVELFTGLVYEGPFLVKRINEELAAHMKQEGMKSIREFHVR